LTASESRFGMASTVPLSAGSHLPPPTDLQRSHPSVDSGTFFPLFVRFGIREGAVTPSRTVSQNLNRLIKPTEANPDLRQALTAASHGVYTSAGIEETAAVRKLRGALTGPRLSCVPAANPPSVLVRRSRAGDSIPPPHFWTTAQVSSREHCAILPITCPSPLPAFTSPAVRDSVCAMLDHRPALAFEGSCIVSQSTDHHHHSAGCSAVESASKVRSAAEIIWNLREQGQGSWIWGTSRSRLMAR
jgi:hypothetical protein